MGNFFEGLSEIATGAMQGYGFAEDMKDKIATRKKKQKDADDAEKASKAGKDKTVFESPINAPLPAQEQTQEPIQIPTANYTGLAAVAPPQQLYPKYKDGGLVRREIGKYADGGLVSMAANPQSVSMQTNMAAGINQDGAAPQAPAQKVDWGRTMSARLNASRDKALELGNNELASQYQEAGFKVRDDLFKKGLPMAQQVFAKTGDITGYLNLYNDTHDDGYNVVSHTKNNDGTYSLKMRQPDGQTADMNMTIDDMQQMVYQLSNPAARKAEEMAAFKERASNIDKANIDIAKENSKPTNLAAGSKMLGNKEGGYITQDTSGKMTLPQRGLDVLADNPKADSSLSETELAFKASKGDADAIKALDLIESHKATIAREGRAPRAPAIPREIPFDTQAYNEYAANPANKGKTRLDFKRAVSEATRDDGTNVESVTTRPSTGFDGAPLLDANNKPIVEKTVTRKNKVQPEGPKAKPALFNKDALFKKYGVK